MQEAREYFATAPRGTEPFLQKELERLGAARARVSGAGVAFCGNLETAYRVCLWSRLAHRVLLPLAEFPAADPEALYAGSREVAWEEHFGADDTFAIEVSAHRPSIGHTHFAAQRVKDAVADRFRAAMGKRPSVDIDAPDISINLHLRGDRALLSLDLGGGSLHKRGYRTHGARAPMKETLAAAILVWAGWEDAALRGERLVDPMCGSGTLCIEAALIAADVAPGLERRRWGFERWRGHQPEVWTDLLTRAQKRRQTAATREPIVYGSDADEEAVQAALSNARRAGVADLIRLSVKEVTAVAAPADIGMVVVNPPYGERLGEISALQGLYATLGAKLKRDFQGWTAYVLTGSDELGRRLGMRATRRARLYNGPIACRLLELPVRAGSEKGSRAESGRAMIRNRLRKNLKKLERWRKQNGISCFCAYDADIPEYAVAIDVYEGAAVLQEYEPPASVPTELAAMRLQDVMEATPEVIGIDSRDLVVKVRRRQRGRLQYQRLDESERFKVVHEADVALWVNLYDYLDTGLFLDGRRVRALIRNMSSGKRFLNLFGYTGAATIFAVKGGARATTTVDLSRRYLEWTYDNFELNQLSGQGHELVRADCIEWLRTTDGLYDVIYVDPPTFSNSKAMRDTFDVQRDHARLLNDAARHLAPEGVLLFSTNRRRFRLDHKRLAGLHIEEITAETRDLDFQKSRRSHRCWRILH